MGHRQESSFSSRVVSLPCILSEWTSMWGSMQKVLTYHAPSSLRDSKEQQGAASSPTTLSREGTSHPHTREMRIQHTATCGTSQALSSLIRHEEDEERGAMLLGRGLWGKIKPTPLCWSGNALKKQHIKKMAWGEEVEKFCPLQNLSRLTWKLLSDSSRHMTLLFLRDRYLSSMIWSTAASSFARPALQVCPPHSPEGQVQTLQCSNSCVDVPDQLLAVDPREQSHS